MSELKYQLMLNKDMSWVPCYLKSEADKVIAELEKKLDIYKRGWMENDKVNANQYAEIRHHKYKRCLAMAMWCDEAYHRECGLNPEEMTDKEFYKQQIEFWPRWSSRWLAIAEKFKPNPTINRKGGTNALQR